MAVIARKIPEKVCNKALRILKKYRRGEIHAITIKGSKNLSLRIGLWYRLLSYDGGMNWEIMSHERYNTEKKRKHLNYSTR